MEVCDYADEKQEGCHSIHYGLYVHPPVRYLVAPRKFWMLEV